MAYLYSNGYPIEIDRDGRVCVTELYKAAGQPANRNATNYKNYKKGKKEIKNYESKQGRWVWESRTGVNTMAIGALACHYLEYIGEPQAADKLHQVQATGQDQYYTSKQYSIQNQSVRDSSSEEGEVNWAAAIIIGILIILILPKCNQQSQTPQYQSPPPPQFRPL